MKAPFTLYRVKHWYEIDKKLFKRPEVTFLLPNQFSLLTEAYQWWWYSLNGGRAVDPTAQKWRGYTNGRAFITDNKGTETYRDVISGRNLKKAYPKIKRLVCGGNVVTGTVLGKNLVIKTLRAPRNLKDIVNPPWGLTYETHPWYIHHATNRATGDVVNPFTQLGGRNTGVPVLYPLVGWGNPAKMPLSLLERIEAGQEIPNPYNPPMPSVEDESPAGYVDPVTPEWAGG